MADAHVLDVEALRQWIGTTDVARDTVTVTPIRAMAAILDREQPTEVGDLVPPCWHWLYCLPLHRQSEIGVDGHPRRGGFLPPVPLPRRMWAGSRVDFRRPLCIGDAITRTSRIVDVTGKEGRSGPLVFVKVRHEIANAAGVAVVEDQDLVYRDATAATADAAARRPTVDEAPDWRRDVHADEVFLFRFSAVTLNGHRIHYDRRYAMEVEGYSGLVVHGPLSAMLLLDLLRRHVPAAVVTWFTFRGVAPLFDGAPFTISGRVSDDRVKVHLWAARPDGALAMDATAGLASEAGR